MAVIERFSYSELPRLVKTVRRTIERGGIAAVPTETYYGLGVSPFDAKAVERLLLVKGRADGKPLLVLVGHRSQLSSLVENVSPLATLLMDTFWPGPLTILFPAHRNLSAHLTGDTGTVGVRLSSCEPLVRMLQEVGPLTGTSANRAGCAPARMAKTVQDTIGPDIDLIIDAGETRGGAPSTIIDGRESAHLIRDGAITRQMIQNVLQTRGIALT
jgi:L-threonylcarbamoyladenylate synthase